MTLDPANALNIATVGRLRAAGLLTVAERVAKREELQLHHVIAIGGDPTGGHVALWRALAAEGKDAAALSAILGWPAAVIEASLARPKPRLVPDPPKSGPRAVVPRKPSKFRIPAELRAMVEVVTEPLRQQIRNLTISVGILSARLERGNEINLTAVELVLSEVSASHGISVATLLGRRRRGAVVEARREAVRRLTDELQMSTTSIGRALKRDHTTVLYYLNGDRRQKAAA